MSDKPQVKNHYVDVGEGAIVAFPTSNLVDQMWHGPNREVCAAAALESFRYLVLECTKEEAWRRILCMREAAKSELTE